MISIRHRIVAAPARLCRHLPAFALVSTAFVFGPARLDAVTVRPIRAIRRAAMARMAVQSVPIITSVPTTQPGAGSFQVTVQVDQVPAGGSSVQVTCTRPDLVASPSGSWPYTLVFPAGSSTTASFTVTASAVSSQTSVTFGSGTYSADVSDPTNWSSSATIAMAPSGSAILQ